MYDYRFLLNDPRLGYRVPSVGQRNARPHPGQRPSEPLDLGCVRPDHRAHGARTGR